MDHLLPTTIEEVISRLDHIVEESLEKGSPMGIFAALYRRVTIRVKEGIEQNEFEDGPRMEKLDVVFANRYLEAHQQYLNNQPTTLSWKLAFDSSERTDLILLQHLLLGINAHINLDLGIAAATISPGSEIQSLQNDFNKINELLVEMTDKVQEEIDQVSPLIWLLDWVAKDKDEKFAEFSIKAARLHAWSVAMEMAGLPAESWDSRIIKLDQGVEKFGQLIEGKSWLLKTAISLIRFFETKDVRKKIEVLS